MNFDKIKEFFTAQYNTKTDKIEGCRYGTYVWYHEYRHKKQFNNKYISCYFNKILPELQNLSLILTPFILFNFNLIYYFGIFYLISFAIPLLCLEIDATIIGTLKYLKEKSKRLR